MWIFSTKGFISAVYKHKAVQVRARDKHSLSDLSEYAQTPIIHTPLADYPYRLVTTNESFASWLSKEAISLDYSNYKSEVETTRGPNFAHPLHKVWSVMHDVEDADARVR